MPACELGDVLARIIELWWEGKHDEAREAHRRVLPLINLESHTFVRYILRRRGIITSTAERCPAPALDAEERREISILLEAVAGDLSPDFPFGDE